MLNRKPSANHPKVLRFLLDAIIALPPPKMMPEAIITAHKATVPAFVAERKGTFVR